MFFTYFVTGKAANAAKQSADIAAQSLTISERAWVRVDFRQLYEPGMSFVDLDITNTGKTPGHIKEIKILGLDVSDAQQPFAWKPDPIPPNERDTLWNIFPGESTTQRYDQLTEFQSVEIWEIIQQTKRLTIYGFILYDDIFGTRRITRFYRVFMETQSNRRGRFMIPPNAEPGQNEAT